MITSLAILIALGRALTDSASCLVKFKIYIGEGLLIEHAIPMNLLDKDQTRCYVRFNGIQILRVGSLRVDVFINENPIGDFSIEIKQGIVPQIVSVQ
jgi:hypothetical protein